MSIIYTEKDKCKSCYACVRSCPVKAIKVEERLAQVIRERCIVCGNCLEVCATGAKKVESDTSLVWQLLSQSDNHLIAVVSSSFPAAMPEVTPGRLVSMLKKLGFNEVMEDSVGAELIGREYKRLLSNQVGKPVLSSNCPAVVNYVEKYYPKLIGYMAHIVSPTIATGRLIKKHYNPRAKVVFIGPCVAKKDEARKPNNRGVIDAVLTFAELKEMLLAKNINAENEPESDFSGPTPDLGRLMSISGGLAKIAGLSEDILKNEVISPNGSEAVSKILKEFAHGEINAKLINLYFCNGCVGGPVIDNDLSIYRRDELVAHYALRQSDPEQTERDLKIYGDIELGRQFVTQNVRLASPEDEGIEEVLRKMGRNNPEEQFNCGACGYSTCHELAVAVSEGLAEIEMCWPYLHKHMQETQEGLIQAEKMTSLGQLAASVAHEINNPLSGVLIYTQLLAKKLKSNNFTADIALDYLSKMETELNRSTRLVRSLLDFSRQSVPEFWEVDINEIIDRSYDLGIHSAEMQNVQVFKDLSADLPKIVADFGQIQQVCTNLIMNAIQAMPGGGTLTIRTFLEDEQVIIEVTDTGVGISPENMKKMFTPFFTTKKDQKGVGLGLAISYGIVQRHHGKIEIITKEGEGTTFKVHLPVRHEEEN
ncbi:MAG: 4Fe-4S binding protein [Dehalococcoidales bacterium]|nr:4Fe-4S binding protein [Dehalococcoidales bacterium]